MFLPPAQKQVDKCWTHFSDVIEQIIPIFSDAIYTATNSRSSGKALVSATRNLTVHCIDTLTLSLSSVLIILPNNHYSL